MRVEAILHVHNRTAFLPRALASLTRALKDGVQIIVSCNCSDEATLNEVGQIARQYDVGFRRSPGTLAIEHFRHSAEQCRADHIVLLHDDDYVLPTYFADILDLLDRHPTAAAVAVEPIFDINGIPQSGRIRLKGDYRLSPFFLGLAYLLGRCGPAFPSICYSTEFLRRSIMQPPLYGKYSDVPLVLDAAHAEMWVGARPSFVYAMHGGNDSAAESHSDRKRLQRYLLTGMLRSLRSAAGVRDAVSNLAAVANRFFKYRRDPT